MLRPQSVVRSIALTAGTLALMHGAASAQNARGIIPPPQPTLDLSVSISSVSPGVQFAVTATVENTGAGTAGDPSVSIVAPPGYAVVCTNPVDLISIPGGETRQATFILESPCPAGPGSVHLAAFNGVVLHEQGDWAFAQATTTLVPNVPFGSDEPERAFHFDVVSSDWSLVALEPSAFDRNIAYAVTGCGPALTTSAEPGQTRDFIVANGHISDGDRYVRVLDGRNGDPYIVKHGRAVDLHYGYQNELLTAFEVGDIFEVELEAGERYQITVEPDFAPADIALFHFDGNRVFGVRSNATHSINEGGNGATESLMFHAQHTGRHAFVVTNENHVSTDLQIGFFQWCDCQFDGIGGIDILDLLGYLSIWFNSDPEADVNADGSTDIIDLLEFLECWFNASPTSC